MKRFLERFQLWRAEQRDSFQDKLVVWLVLMAVVVVSRDAYTLFTTGRLGLRDALASVWAVAFAILYFRQSRWAWLFLIVPSAAAIVQAPLAYTSVSHGPMHVRVLTAFLIAAFGIAGVAYSLSMRRRFRALHTSTPSQAIQRTAR
jgi:hypothetical protein